MSDEDQQIVEDEYVSGEDMIMRAISDAQVDETDDSAEPEVVENVVEEPAAVEEQPMILNKFKSYEDLETAYKELERRFHEKANEPEPEAEEYEEPVPLVNFNMTTPETEDDLIEWSEQDPTRAALWAIENQQRMSEETFNEVYRNWWQERPWEAAAFQREQDMLLMQDYMAQQIQPFQSQHEQQMMEKANSVLLQRVPDIQEYAEKVQDFIENNDVSSLIPPEAMSDPDVLANGIDMIIGIIKWKEHQTALSTNPPVVEDQFVSSPATTVNTGNTAVADDGLGNYEEQIRNFILNG